MGNVSSAIHRNGRGKTWKKSYKLKTQNFSNITEKIDATTNLDIPISSHIKMNQSNDSNINLDVTNNIEHVISPEQIASQAVSLARESIDFATQSKKLPEIEQNKNNIENNITEISELEEISSQIIKNHSPKSEKRENHISSKDYSKHKGIRRKEKQMKENAPLEIKNDSIFISKKGILKKEDLENETAVYLTAGCNSSGDIELPLQISNDPDNVFNTNVAVINSVHNLTLKNGAATAYMFDSKRKKNVRFNDKVVIIYYTSAECQQQAIRNGTFITSVIEPLKVALQQQQRNRELRNKHSYTHTVFPTAVRCGKS